MKSSKASSIRTATVDFNFVKSPRQSVELSWRDSPMRFISSTKPCSSSSEVKSERMKFGGSGGSPEEHKYVLYIRWKKFYRGSRNPDGLTLAWSNGFFSVCKLMTFSTKRSWFRRDLLKQNNTNWAIPFTVISSLSTIDFKPAQFDSFICFLSIYKLLQ